MSVSAAVYTGIQIAGAISALYSNWKKGQPGEIESLYKQSALDDLNRLRGGRGGMALSERQAAQSEALGQIQSAAAEAEAEAHRGVAPGSGQAFTAQEGLYKAKLGAQQQAMSNIRQQDLEEAQRQRQEAYQKAAVANQMRETRINRTEPQDWSKLQEGAQKFGKLIRGGVGDSAKDVGSGITPTPDISQYTAQGLPTGIT